MKFPDSTDPSLSALSLEDTSSNTIELDPVFASDTLTYTASTAISASTVTLSLTKSHSDATLNIWTGAMRRSPTQTPWKTGFRSLWRPAPTSSK